MAAPINPARGERHGRARLTTKEVDEMREVWERWREVGSKKGYGSIGAAFGVSPWTARDIVLNRTRTQG